jgi:hypothetical protein
MSQDALPRGRPQLDTWAEHSCNQNFLRRDLCKRYVLYWVKRTHLHCCCFACVATKSARCEISPYDTNIAASRCALRTCPLVPLLPSSRNIGRCSSLLFYPLLWMALHFSA